MIPVSAFTIAGSYALVMYRSLPWKLNKGHPGPERTLPVIGQANAVPLHGSRSKGKMSQEDDENTKNGSTKAA